MSELSKNDIKKYIINPHNTGNKYLIVNDALINLFGDFTRASICAILIGMNDYFAKKAIEAGNGYDGSFYQTHKQIMNRFPKVTSQRVISDAFKIAVELEILSIEKRNGKDGITKNYFTLNVPKVRQILLGNLDVKKEKCGIKKDFDRSVKKDSLTNTNKDNKYKFKNNSSKEESAPPSSDAFKMKRRVIVSMVNGKKIYTLFKGDSSSRENHQDLAQDIAGSPGVEKGPLNKNSMPGGGAPPPPSKLRRSTQVDLEEMSCDPFKKGKAYIRKHPETMSDIQLYNALVQAGATNHRKDTKSYSKTMDAIHELISPKFRNPYSKISSIPDDYKVKDWTYDEILDAFKYYLAKTSNKKYANIKQFIHFQSYNNKDWSPLVKFHMEMIKNSIDTLEGDEKVFMKELQEMNLNVDINAQNIRNSIKLLDLFCSNLRISQQLNHLYYNNVIYAFSEYIRENVRRASFKIYYIQSESFLQNFVNEFKTRGVLVQEGSRVQKSQYN